MIFFPKIGVVIRQVLSLLWHFHKSALAIILFLWCPRLKMIENCKLLLCFHLVLQKNFRVHHKSQFFAWSLLNLSNSTPLFLQIPLRKKFCNALNKVCLKLKKRRRARNILCPQLNSLKNKIQRLKKWQVSMSLVMSFYNCHQFAIYESCH